MNRVESLFRTPFTQLPHFKSQLTSGPLVAHTLKSLLPGNSCYRTIIKLLVYVGKRHCDVILIKSRLQPLPHHPILSRAATAIFTPQSVEQHRANPVVESHRSNILREMKYCIVVNKYANYSFNSTSLVN